MPSNSWRAFAEPHGTSFLAMVQVAHRAEPYALRERGKPILFPSYGAANRAAHEHIVSLLNSPIYAQITKPTESETLQQEVFGTVFRKGHATKVERKRRRVPA